MSASCELVSQAIDRVEREMRAEVGTMAMDDGGALLRATVPASIAFRAGHTA